MTIEEALSEKLKKLPPAKQRAVLDFAESLAEPDSPPLPLLDPAGLWAGFDIRISEDDIAELRCEIWKKFARDHI